MTVKEIDERIAQIRSTMGTQNFCITFELADIQRLEKIKEIFIRIEGLSKDVLIDQYIRLQFDLDRVTNQLNSVTEQRNHAWNKLGIK